MRDYFCTPLRRPEHPGARYGHGRTDGRADPYAVVLFPGTTTGITTDDEGFYSLESRDTSSYIRAEMVSYEPQIRPVHVGGYNQIDFRLTPSHLEIESVVITPGDNPAHPILEGIIRNKKYNDSKEYDRYICRTYTKMELGLANIREFRSKNSNRISVSSSST